MFSFWLPFRGKNNISSKRSESIAPLKLLMAQAFFGSIIFILLSVVFESDPYKFSLILLISILYQGAIVAGFNFIANIWLLKNYKPSQVTVIHLSQPIFGILIGYVVLGEKIGLLVVLGAAFVILGSVLVRKKFKLNASFLMPLCDRIHIWKNYHNFRRQ